MQKYIEFELGKYADVLGKIAFLLAAIYKHACSLVDKDLPPGQYTRLVPEVMWYHKQGRLLIVWIVKERDETTGNIDYRREWPNCKQYYNAEQLRSIAHPSELRLASKIEQCFAWLREASATKTAMIHTAKRLDKIAGLLSSRVRGLNNIYQGHAYGGNVEDILAGFHEDQDIWEDLTERAVRDET